jgi:hypothetical protein
MIEVFKYTERIVAMIRPRKLLFIAIGEFLAFPCHPVALTVSLQTVSPQELK